MISSTEGARTEKSFYINDMFLFFSVEPKSMRLLYTRLLTIEENFDTTQKRKCGKRSPFIWVVLEGGIWAAQKGKKTKQRRKQRQKKWKREKAKESKRGLMAEERGYSDLVPQIQGWIQMANFLRHLQ